MRLLTVLVHAPLEKLEQVNATLHRILAMALALTASGWSSVSVAQETSAPKSPLSVQDPLLSGRPEGGLYPLLQSANHGDPHAKYELGLEYKVGGWPVSADRERALQWFEEAALAGVPAAMTQVGTLYEEGLEGPPDHAEAAFWYRRARAAKDAGGTLALAEMSCEGIGTPRDVPGCASLLGEAIEDLKPSDSRYDLRALLAKQLVETGKRYQSGDGVRPDTARAYRLYEQAGAMGDADGILAGAALVMDQDSTHNGPVRALELLKVLVYDRDSFGPDKKPLNNEQMKALVDSLKKIATLYEQRKGEDVAQAIPVEILLTKLEKFDGAIQLAKRYARGDGVSRIASNAEQLISAVGDPESLDVFEIDAYWRVEGTLAEDYFTGQGASKDIAKGLRLYRSAAENGNVGSSIALGLIYAEGTSVHFDADKAEKYLKLDLCGPPTRNYYCVPNAKEIAQLPAIDRRRFGKAARLLGEHYQAGNLVRKDLFVARQWYGLGADAGDAVAKARLAQIPVIVPEIRGVPGGVVASAGFGTGVMGAAPAPRVGSAAPAREPTVEERYPNIDAPEVVHPSQKFAVLVSLTGEQISPETRILSGNQRNGKLQIPMPPGMTSIDLEVNLSAPGMEFIDGSNIGQIELTAGQDSTVAQFHLRTLADGNAAKPVKLIATFWYNHGFIARVARDIVVTPDASSRPTDSLRQAVPPEMANRPAAGSAQTRKVTGSAIVLEPEMAVPDLTIIENRTDDTLHLTFVTRYSSPVEAALPKALEMRQYIGMKLGELSQRGRGLTPEGQTHDVRRGEDLARGFGDELYDRFAPLGFKQLYWQLRDAGVRLRTIQVLSDDPMLPWEMMRPARANGQDRQDFMGLTARVARWQLGATGLPRPPQELLVHKMVVIAPQYATSIKLDAAQQEADSLRGQEGFESVKGDYSDVRTLAAQPPNGIIHFAGHGVMRTESGEPQFAILLEDSELEPATWKALALVRDTHPFYFFNACEVGQARQAVGTLDGWAPALLDTGASGYLGALWPVSDQVAGLFAVNFYRILLANTSAPVAEVVREAKQRTFDDTHDPTALSYVLYADPFLQVRR